MFSSCQCWPKYESSRRIELYWQCQPHKISSLLGVSAHLSGPTIQWPRLSIWLALLWTILPWNLWQDIPLSSEKKVNIGRLWSNCLVGVLPINNTSEFESLNWGPRLYPEKKNNLAFFIFLFFYINLAHHCGHSFLKYLRMPTNLFLLRVSNGNRHAMVPNF